MTGARTVKASRSPRTVAVVASFQDLDRARRLRLPPDFFELRLDALVRDPFECEAVIAGLRAPLIVTARHPKEGGFGKLSLRLRRDLLLRFLPRAAFVDVELRSAAQLQPVLEAASARNVGRIFSLHDLNGTPGAGTLLRQARHAASLDARIFKVATRVDTSEQADRLLEFQARARAEFIAVAVMGFGALGRSTRIALARAGSALNYVHLGTPQTDGQLSLAEMRRIAPASTID